MSRQRPSKHIHVYGPEEPNDQTIVQLHDALHNVIRTYESGPDGWQIDLWQLIKDANYESPKTL